MPKIGDKTHLIGRPVTGRPRVDLPNRTNLPREGARRPDASFISSIHNPLMCLAVSAPPGLLLFSELKIQIREHYEELKITVPDLSPLDEAFKLASLAHAGQFREAGAPYINHPLEAALEMVKSGWVEIPALAAIILHDSVEDTVDKPLDQQITIPRIKEKLGVEIATLVDGLTKLRKLGRSKEMRNVKSFKKFIEFASQDIRIVGLKLFDRLVNSRTFDSLPPDRARENALETLEIYVPIAYGFGLWQVKNELEANSLKILDHDAHGRIEGMMGEETGRTKQEVSAVRRQVSAGIQKITRKRVEFTVDYTANPLSDIYRMLREEGEISIEDKLHVFTIEIPEKYCDRVIRVLHGLYNHIPETYADYLSNPRLNRYRALHTIVFIPGIGNVMFKIMSSEMRRLADLGILSGYTPQDTAWYKYFGDKYPWFDEIVGYLKERGSLTQGEIRDIMQGSVFSMQVFTSKGDAIRLPPKATTRDFAYKIHTELGFEGVLAKVHRGRRTYIDTDLSMELKPFDRVEVIRQAGRRPEVADLDKVVTVLAQREIRAYLRSLPPEVVVQNGINYLTIEMKRPVMKRITEKGKMEKIPCYISPLGLGYVKEVSGRQIRVFGMVLKRLNAHVAKEIKSVEDLFYLVGIGNLSVEPILSELVKYIDAIETRVRKPHIFKVTFETDDRPGILAAISRPIAKLGLNIVDVKTDYLDSKARLIVQVRVFNNVHEAQVESIIGEVGKIIKVD